MTTMLGMPGPAPEPIEGVSPSIGRPADPLHWGGTFRDGSRAMLPNRQLRHNLGHATRTIREKRLRAVAEMPDWEALRAAGSAIKTHTMATLDTLLVQLEENVTAAGGVVHWARDAAEANEIVGRLVLAAGVEEVLKVKSMATQEIGLNEALAELGVEATETDLAELIVHLSQDMPSHIVVPAIHRNRDEIRRIFLARMEGAPADLTDEPRALAMASREFLRRRFLSAKVAISGANFAVAETGTLSVFESEGNGRMCLTMPETLITVMGIEKLVPTWRDLEVFTQLLPRSSTAERMNPYTSFWTGVTPGDGPQTFHLVLLDNGRTRALADEAGRPALNCIRCSACMNVCPVYEQVGGHAYGSVYPGPIGAILTPLLTGDERDDTLPYASTLCGACYEACPVAIDIPSILVHLRERATEREGVTAWGAAMKAAAWAMSSPGRFTAAERALTLAHAVTGEKEIRRLPFPGSLWTRTRDVPAPPAQTFRDWWKEREG